MACKKSRNEEYAGGFPLGMESFEKLTDPHNGKAEPTTSSPSKPITAPCTPKPPPSSPTLKPSKTAKSKAAKFITTIPNPKNPTAASNSESSQRLTTSTGPFRRASQGRHDAFNQRLCLIVCGARASICATPLQFGQHSSVCVFLQKTQFRNELTHQRKLLRYPWNALTKLASSFNSNKELKISSSRVRE
jgi:hypothetical protein